MQFHDNIVLITGGASGIGLALAEQFLQAGSTVITCGRREAKLKEAQAQYLPLDYRVCNVADAQDRQSLFEWAIDKYPNLNIKPYVQGYFLSRQFSIASIRSLW